MKKYIKIALTFGALTFATGCGSALDLQPAQSVVTDQALRNADDLQALLVGAYNIMSDDDVLGAKVQMLSELLGDNGEISWVGTFPAPREYFNKRMFSASADVSSVWIRSYEVINTANTVLDYIPRISIPAEATKNRIEGEARLIRAVMNFELVRMYGKNWEAGQPNTDPNSGIPLMTKPSNAEKVGRSTTAEVYASVLEDLTKAETLLPTSNGFFANKWVAAAYLSRVYLQQGDYEKARDAANRVIASNRYSLTAEFADAFNKPANTTEDIFAIQSSVQDNVNNMFTYYAPQDIGGRGDIPVLPAHLATYESGDARRAMFYVASGDTWFGKWQEPNAGNVNVIRLAEMYLTRAECNFRLNTTVGAAPLADVNRIRNRAKLSSLTTLTLDAILKERKLELFAEGNRIHEVKRLKLTLRGLNAGGMQISLPYNAPALVVPIPQREINVNKNLVQNPGY